MTPIFKKKPLDLITQEEAQKLIQEKKASQISEKYLLVGETIYAKSEKGYKRI
jgi:hypothetical protein